MTSSDEVSPFLTTRQVADRLRLSVRTVQKLLRANEMPGCVRVGKQYRIREASLTAWLDSGGSTEDR